MQRQQHHNESVYLPCADFAVGWEYINRKEANMGQVFKTAGYRTGQFGKW